ncbi:unnamed protein product [Durusdinium trenchii]|uniref:Uncharacterized protein n=1 Tax=Durusdinium trenchii TaxID=1381693 RepID=A0ABP0QJW1_9DINO
MDLDRDVVYWNAHAFCNSKLLAALKDLLALRAAQFTVEKGWDPFLDASIPGLDTIPPPFYEKWKKMLEENSSLGLLIEEVLQVCWEDVEPIIKENEGSKLQRLMTEKLSWALEVGSCWLHWKSISRPGGSPRMCAGDLPQKLLETESQCQALQNDRPRLLLQKKMGSKVKRVDVDFYRADLTDLPFEFGETCFFLVSKFSDLPMAEMLTNRGTALGSLACRFDGLQEHMAIIEATGRLEDYVMVANPEAVHHLHVFEDLPHEDVPFGVGVVDLGSKDERVQTEQLYQDLLCLEPVLKARSVTHLLTVLTGYGPSTMPFFAEATVHHTLKQLCGLVEYLARHCKSLRRVTVASYKSETAQQIREYFSGGRTVGETSIDELQRQLRDVGFTRWLEAFHLHAALAARRTKRETGGRRTAGAGGSRSPPRARCFTAFLTGDDREGGRRRSSRGFWVGMCLTKLDETLVIA